MKKILIINLLLSWSVMAETKEKTLDIKAHVNSMTMEKTGTYRLELKEYAAAYMADEKHYKCLQKSMKENKPANLKVHAYSLKVLECKID